MSDSSIADLLMDGTKTISQLNPDFWVASHADYLYAFALNRLNNEEKARDLVQDTFLAALEKVAGFKGGSSERTWLTAILKHKIVDVYRSQARNLRSVRQSETGNDDDFFENDQHHWKRQHWPQPLGIEDHDPLHNKELAEVLRHCMGKLPALWHAVFTMKHMDDESTDHICAALKLSSANYWVIVHRAKVNLRSCLQKNWE